MSTRPLLAAAVVLGVGRPTLPASPASPAALAAQARPIDASAFDALSYRAVGPAAIGGRLTDVAGVPGDPDIVYLASASGGLFRSTNGGTTFEPIFEDQPVLSIGAIALEAATSRRPACRPASSSSSRPWTRPRCGRRRPSSCGPTGSSASSRK